MTKQRLQKVLSHAGLGSRRQIEAWISEGLFTINGKVAQLGDGVELRDLITYQGRRIANPLQKSAAPRVLLYHKPVGEICSREDPQHGRTVFDSLPALDHERWVMVGRLDVNTSGLLLFTNQGELAHRLMHPSFDLEREYAVRVRGTVTEEMQKRLQEGVKLEDGLAAFKSVRFQGGDGSNAWYHVILMEGKNREVRRLFASQGVEVSRLIRVRDGDFTLPRELRRGQYRELSAQEVQRFMKAMNVSGIGATVEVVPQKEFRVKKEFGVKKGRGVKKEFVAKKESGPKKEFVAKKEFGTKKKFGVKTEFGGKKGR